MTVGFADLIPPNKGRSRTKVGRVDGQTGLVVPREQETPGTERFGEMTRGVRTRLPDNTIALGRPEHVHKRIREGHALLFVVFAEDVDLEVTDTHENLALNDRQAEFVRR